MEFEAVLVTGTAFFCIFIKRVFGEQVSDIYNFYKLISQILKPLYLFKAKCPDKFIQVVDMNTFSTTFIL